MEFLCPRCSLLMADNGSLAGQTATCPRCGQPFICPGNTSAVPVIDNIVRLPSYGNFSTSAVGVTHSQHYLESLCGGRTTESANHECKALLTPESHNPHDRLAVNVSINGYVIGYLSQGAARRWRAWLKRHNVAILPAMCDAMIVGGWYRNPVDMGHFGVRLDLPLRDSAYD